MIENENENRRSFFHNLLKTFMMFDFIV